MLQRVHLKTLKNNSAIRLAVTVSCTLITGNVSPLLLAFGGYAKEIGQVAVRMVVCLYNREGSLTCFFWFALRVPKSQPKELTAEKVNTMLYRKLLASTNQTGHFAYRTEYKIEPKSLVLLGKS